MENTTSKYYINYRMFIGDEHTGESVTDGTIIDADGDREAVQKLTKYVIDERKGEVTQINCVQNVTELMEIIKYLPAEEGIDADRGNIAFAVVDYLYGR